MSCGELKEKKRRFFKNRKRELEIGMKIGSLSLSFLSFHVVLSLSLQYHRRPCSLSPFSCIPPLELSGEVTGIPEAHITHPKS